MQVSNSVPVATTSTSSQSGLRPAGSKTANSGGTEIDEQAAKRLDYLKERDREVRAHEAAHLAAAGGLAKGGATFKFETGADGQTYAVGGEVNIDISSVSGNPNATLRKAEIIRRAALAPADPSSQDQQVAASANQLENQARRELAELATSLTQTQARNAYADVAGNAKSKASSLHLTA